MELLQTRSAMSNGWLIQLKLTTTRMHILLLILTQWLEIDDVHSVTQLLEQNTTQGLHQNVHKLIPGRNMLDGHPHTPWCSETLYLCACFCRDGRDSCWDQWRTCCPPWALAKPSRGPWVQLRPPKKQKSAIALEFLPYTHLVSLIFCTPTCLAAQQ